MSLMEIASRTAVTLADIESLTRGDVSDAVARRLGVPLLVLQEFLARGETSANLAHRLGTSMRAAEDLAAKLGSEGRIGILLGLMLSTKQGRAAEATSFEPSSSSARAA